MIKSVRQTTTVTSIISYVTIGCLKYQHRRRRQLITKRPVALVFNAIATFTFCSNLI